MTIRPVRCRADLDAALARVEALWGAAPGTPEADELDVLLVLIEAYEAEHHAIPPGDPIEVIRYKLGELGISQNALAHKLGWTSGRVSEVLHRKRALTLAMVQDLAAELGVTAALLGGAERGAEAGVVTVRLPAGLAAQIAALPGLPTQGLDDRVAALARAGIRALGSASPGSRRPEGPLPANNASCFGLLSDPSSPHFKTAA